MARLLRLLGIFVLILLAGFVVIQLVPYGHNHINPPVVTQIQWDSPQTEQLARTACFDCHSNQTQWYWFTRIAPASWLATHDVQEGRQRLNFSDLTSGREIELDEIDRTISRGSMPPLQYTLIHPNARLNATEKQQLITGLNQSLINTLSGQ